MGLRLRDGIDAAWIGERYGLDLKKICFISDQQEVEFGKLWMEAGPGITFQMVFLAEVLDQLQ